MFHIVIDETGFYSTRANLGEHAITKVINKDIEFIGNETYTDKERNIYRKFDKQDCELKTAYRLLNKIKKRFSKLHIIIGGDALYLGKPFLEYRETNVPTIKRNFDEIIIIKNNYILIS